MSARRTVDRKKSRISHRGGKSKNSGKDKNKLTMKEVLLMQCVACSVLLLGGLVLNINNPYFVNEFGDNFRKVVSNNSLLPSSDYFLNVRNYVMGILNNETQNNYAADNNTDFRIDEDILREINLRNEMRNDTYDEKK